MESGELDAYSRVVSGVAAELTPKVASLRVPQGSGRREGSGGRGRDGGRGGESLGSGVVFTGDGFLLTNAHVVGGATSGTAAFADGSTTPVRAGRGGRAGGRPAGGGGGQPPRPGRLGHRRGSQRPGPVPAHPQRGRGTADR